MIHHFTHPIRGGLFVHPPVDPHRYVSKEREREKKKLSPWVDYGFLVLSYYILFLLSSHGIYPHTEGFFLGGKRPIVVNNKYDW